MLNTNDLNTVYDDSEILYSVCTLFENAEVSRDIEQKEKLVEREFINFERTVQIETQPVRVLLDSGASINILNFQTFEKINKHLRKPLILKKTKTKVTTFGNFEPNLKIKGEVHVLVETKTKFINTNFYVVDTKHKNILSGVTSIALNLISLHKTKNVCVLSDYNQSEAKNKPIKTVYAEAVNQKLPSESERKEIQCRVRHLTPTYVMTNELQLLNYAINNLHLA